MNAITTFQSIITLRQDCETKIHELGKKSKLGHELLDYLFKNPIVDSQDITSQLSKGTSTVFRLIDDFLKLGILSDISGNKRNRVFMFTSYVELFE